MDPVSTLGECSHNTLAKFFFDADHQGSGVSYISIFVGPAKRPLYTALIGTYVSHFLIFKGKRLTLTTMSSFWGLGAILGPVIGGAFAQSKATWRW